MPVRTRTVKNRMVGGARKELKSAAGSNAQLSKSEAKKLKRDVARAAEAVRTRKGRVTVNDAVDEYASRATRALAAVDTRNKGVLSQAEVGNLRDPALRERAAAALTGEASVPAPAPSGAAAAIIAAISDLSGDLSLFHESGDHGVNTSIRKVPGATLQAVLGKAHLDPAAPWTQSETRLELSPATGAAAIAAFNQAARDAMERERDDVPDVVQTFTEAVSRHFGALTPVRLAEGRDLGASYLIGKAADGYVVLVSQPYSDG